jgi:DNA-binding NtrC family response regulator
MTAKSISSFSTHGRLFHTRAPRIVVADDDPDIRAELADALAADGCLVAEARDGYELLGLLAASVTSNRGKLAYDAIVTDVMMPGFSGLDVLTAVRRHLVGVPVVVVTGFGDARTCRAAEALGTVSVVRKPLDLDDLKTTLVNALNLAASPAHPRDS